MRTLIILPHHFHTNFRMKGLSIKKVRELCKDETGYYISNYLHTNGRSCQIEKNYLIDFLKELYQEIPFDAIKIKGHYEITGEELYKLVIN